MQGLDNVFPVTVLQCRFLSPFCGLLVHYVVIGGSAQ